MKELAKLKIIISYHARSELPKKIACPIWDKVSTTIIRLVFAYILPRFAVSEKTLPDRNFTIFNNFTNKL